MTTLASDVAIGDTQLLIDTPFAAGLLPGLVKIGSEILVVGGEEHLTGTTLALSQPATGTHSSGATVTYAGRPYDANFLAATSGVGGEQTIRLLGPFHVAHDTAGLLNPAGDYLDLGASLTVGQMVIRAFVVVTETLTGGDAAEYMDVTVGSLANNQLIGQWLATIGVQESVEVEAPARYVDGSPEFLPYAISRAAVVTQADTKLLAALWSSGTPSSGEFDIYALIAEPAV